jgi:hypothetical protein
MGMRLGIEPFAAFALVLALAASGSGRWTITGEGAGE